MFDSPKELLDKIALGEDSYLEIKEVRFAADRVAGPTRDALADELAGFANARGGVCVLGVADATREVVGISIDKLDIVEAFVREVCNDSITPPLALVIERMRLPSSLGDMRAVLRLDVPRSLWVHQSPGGYFHRIGSSKRPMPPDLLARLFQQRSQTRLIRFDEQTVARATLDDIAPNLWERFRTGRTSDERESLLSKLGMARKDEEGIWRPTVAGILLATRDPRTWLPNAFIQAVGYRGTSVVPEGPRDLYQIDAKDLTGPADEQIIEACRFVFRNMKIGATKEMGRRDFPQYDMVAVFEAVVNAVAHRDYSVHSSKIRLRVFADRLELYAPGTIANTLTIESLPYLQATRNETLCSMLARCPIPDGLDWLKTDRMTLMERRGEGVRIILGHSEKLSGRRPVYRLFDDAELMLTIYAASLDESADPADDATPQIQEPPGKEAAG